MEKIHRTFSSIKSSQVLERIGKWTMGLRCFDLMHPSLKCWKKTSKLESGFGWTCVVMPGVKNSMNELSDHLTRTTRKEINLEVPKKTTCNHCILEITPLLGTQAADAKKHCIEGRGEINMMKLWIDKLRYLFHLKLRPKWFSH